MPTRSRSVTLNAGSHQTGSDDITTIWLTNDQYVVFYDTTPWQPTDTCSGRVEFSPDGGTTWGWGCENTTSGGPRTTSKGAAWGCGCSAALPGRTNWPSPAGWPANPATVLVRFSYSVPSTQTTTMTETVENL